LALKIGSGKGLPSHFLTRFVVDARAMSVEPATVAQKMAIEIKAILRREIFSGQA
jgi:hypothetical protein